MTSRNQPETAVRQVLHFSRETNGRRAAHEGLRALPGRAYERCARPPSDASTWRDVLFPDCFHGWHGKWSSVGAARLRVPPAYGWFAGLPPEGVPKSPPKP